MKYLPLLWANLWRKRIRTILTLLSIVVAFLLFGLLETVDIAFSRPSAGVTGADKLITTNKYSITLSLPFAHVAQIAAVPGVDSVTWLSWFGGYFQEPKNFIFVNPIDVATYFRVHQGEFVVDEAQMREFARTRSGALVNTALMKKFGWRVGDKLPLHSTIWSQKAGGSLDWIFDIVGTFDAKDPTQARAQSSTVMFRYDMFDEGRAFGAGTVGWMEERIDNPADAARVAAEIDKLFVNSSNETRTQPANDFTMSFIKQLGDIAFVLHAILGAVFFTLLFLTGNMMMQSFRERTPEVGILKTVGFGNGLLVKLIVAESLLLIVPPAAVGLALSFALLPVLKEGLPGIEVSADALAPGLLVAFVIGLVIAAAPAFNGIRLGVVEALSRQR